jgi:hypothetical protein
MTIDLWALYALMDRSRRFERAAGSLWQAGLISGEMHTGRCAAPRGQRQPLNVICFHQFHKEKIICNPY